MMFRVVLNVFEAFLGKIIQQGRTSPPSTSRWCEGGIQGRTWDFYWTNVNKRAKEASNGRTYGKWCEGDKKVRRRLKTDWFDRSDAEMRFLIQTKCFMLEPCV